MNKEQLQESITALRRKLNVIEEQEHMAEARQHVGKHYKYKNSYGVSSPGGWWLYFRCDRAAPGGILHGLSFQTDSRGKVDITPKECYSRLLSGYQPISAAEFRRALRSVKARVEAALTENSK